MSTFTKKLVIHDNGSGDMPRAPEPNAPAPTVAPEPLPTLGAEKDPPPPAPPIFKKG